jgi:predicted GIY-YIG superfamily endonuclease
MIRDHFVYRLFDASGALLYIGCTKRLQERWGTHTSERPHMTRRVARCRLQGPYSYTVAREIERQALRSEAPEFGWTPAKRSEVAKRNRWIDERTRELSERPGMEFASAVRVAVMEAEDCWPNPVAHEWSERRLRVVS